MRRKITIILLLFFSLEIFAADNDFERIITNWQDILVGYRYFDNSQQMNDLQEKSDRTAKKLWGALNKEDKRKFLWDFGENNDASSSITKNYRNIQALAVAVMNPKSKYYNDTRLLEDIISSLDWMKENKYSSSLKAEGNWWDYEIGAPRAVNDIFVILYPVVDKKYMEAYLRNITHFVPDSGKMRGSVNPKLVMEATAANQVDISKVKILQSALLHDEEGLISAVAALDKVFSIVAEGDGFYSDGSFIQHDNVAYTASYGNVLLDGLSELITLLESTRFNVKYENIDFWIKEAFTPIMYKGLTMDMVKGRALSREKSYLSSQEIVRSVIRLADVEKDKYKSMYYKQLAKSWIIKNTYFDYIQNLNNYRDIYLAKLILSDKSIKAWDLSDSILKYYCNMDRVVYKSAKNGFAVGISMSSNKTKYYETMNGENVKGWYTGDGMFYLYNGDIRQFNDDFWATVDPYRLSGITVEKSLREDASGVETASRSSVSGKTIDGMHGIYKMHLSNFMKTLDADKSYEIDEDKILFKGSNINFAEGSIVETIIENRKLNDDTQYEIYIDGKKIILDKGKELVLQNVKSIYLKSGNKNESIKYIFPKGEKLHIKLDERQGSWKQINRGQSDILKRRVFLTIFKIHEKQNDSYDYVIIPCK